MKALHRFLTKVEPPNWVMAILALVILGRIPSLFEPYYYGDEMIYLTLGNAIRKGITLYSKIHDNKPPLIYLIAALAGNLFWFKAILMFWILATIIIFWHLTEELFKENKLAQKVSVVIFAILTTIPLFEGNTVNAELFLIGPVILGILLLLKNPTNKNLFLAGLAFSIAVLFKVPAIFDMAVIPLFWLITLKSQKDFIQLIKRLIILISAFSIPILLTLLWYFFKGALTDYIKAAFLQNISYLSSWGGAKSASFVVKNGPLLIKAGLVLTSLIILRVKSAKSKVSASSHSNVFTIACIWLATSLFAATLSARPYPHYLVQSIPPLSLLIAILVSSPRLEQVLTVIPLTIAILVPVYYHFWYYPTLPYYERFFSYLTKSISKDQYFNEFSRETVNNYEISEKIQELATPDEKIFVYGENAPVIYALSRRLPSIKYTANYHITDFSSIDEITRELKTNPPALIILLPDAQTPSGIRSLVNAKYLELQNKNASIWRLIKTNLK